MRCLSLGDGEEVTGWVTAMLPVPACHWDELVFPPCHAGENFAAEGCAHVHEVFNYS